MCAATVLCFGAAVAAFVAQGRGLQALPLALLALATGLLVTAGRRWGARHPESDNALFVRGLLSGLLFALGYGFFEYYADANASLLGPGNFRWYADALAATAFVVSYLGLGPQPHRRCARVEIALFNLYSLMVHEDLVYFVALGIDGRRYPFPTANWYDQAYPFLCGLGQPLPFFPHFPCWYPVAWVGLGLYVLLWWHRARASGLRRLQRVLIYAPTVVLVVLGVVLPWLAPMA